MEITIGIVVFVCALWLFINQYEKHLFNKAIGEPTRIILGLIESSNRFSLIDSKGIGEDVCGEIILHDNLNTSTTCITRVYWYGESYMFKGDLSWMNKQEKILIGEKCYEIVDQRRLEDKKKKEKDKKEQDDTRRKKALEIYK